MEKETAERRRDPENNTTRDRPSRRQPRRVVGQRMCEWRDKGVLVLKGDSGGN